MANEVALHKENAVSTPETFSLEQVVHQVTLIQQVMQTVMKDGEHFGVIPGTGNKPSLLKAGAEKLCLTFRLDPQYETTEKQEGQHLTVVSKCTLYHIPTGQRFGSGMGSCSTKESKYAYRSGSQKCPSCGSGAIIKGKKEYGGGFICFAKKGGCGAKFDDKDERITSQSTGRVPNEDLPDQYNTVLKMANKRSLVAAVLNTTAASDIFTQDIEDMPQFAAPSKPEREPDIFDNGAPPIGEKRQNVLTDDDLVASIGPMVKRKDFDGAYDMARSIKDDTVRADITAKIDKAHKYVADKAAA